jgi:biopolymer transport protein ExbD
VAVVAMPSLPLGFLALALALALAELGCSSTCDEAGLQSVAAAFEARTFEQRAQGFDALEQACPALPPTLARSLRVEFDGTPADARELLYVDRDLDPAWNELYARTCPPLGEEGIISMGPPTKRDFCQLDRYGLFAAEDVYVDRDLVVFMLYEWLLAGRSERMLAGDVARPLLSANASPAQLESMCLHEGLACRWVALGWGLQLPFSSIDVPPRGGTAVRITATELFVDDTSVLTLDSGRPAPGTFVQHVAPALQQALAARAEHGRTHAERELGMPWPARVELVADRATPFGTIVDVVFTATAAGFDETELVVRSDEVVTLAEGLRAIPLPRPGAELVPHPHLRPEHPWRFILFVHRDFVEAAADKSRRIPNLPGCEPSSSLCVDRETIAGMSKQLKMLYPRETEVTLRVDADVPLEAVVAIVDAVRGEGCHLRPSLEGGEVEPECEFFRPIIDAEPPLRFPEHPSEEEPP